MLHKIKERNANQIGHILRRNCLLQHVTEGKIEGKTEGKGTGRRRRKQLLYKLEERKDTGN